MVKDTGSTGLCVYVAVITTILSAGMTSMVTTIPIQVLTK